MSSSSPKRLRKIIQYLISLLAAVALLYWVFRKQSWEDIVSRIAGVEWYLIGISLALGLFSHWVRAYRWNLLLEPLGYRPPVGRTLLAVLVGYIANLAIPRLGEVARCAFLDRKAGVPVATGFGTVVMERLLDVLSILAIAGIVLCLEFSHVLGFFREQLLAKGQSINLSAGIWIVLGLCAVAGLALLWWFFKGGGRAVLAKHPLYRKVEPVVLKFVEGIVSIRNLNRPVQFWAATFLMWLCYFLMTYLVIIAYPATSQLGLSEGLAVLVVGGFGMAAPVQGGFGAYHFLVANFLLIYNIATEDGIALAALLHTSHTVIVIVVGSIALLLGLLIPRHVNTPLPTEANELDSSSAGS
ncbi:MAG: lysylphosphatidylglycerol synthase transmembrane domain-containing protein [Bacteroidota bacterium]